MRFLPALACSSPSVARPMSTALVALALLPGAALAEHSLTAAAPIREPVALSFSGAPPEFRFASEVTNAGLGRPDLPRRILLVGTGAVHRGIVATVWDLAVQQVMVDQQTLRGNVPLAVLRVEIDNARPEAVTAYRDFRGLNAAAGNAAGSPAMRMVRSVIGAAALATYLPPAQPVSQQMPLLNLTAAVDRYVSSSLRQARVVQPVPPGVASGLVAMFGRPAIEVSLSGPYAIQYGPSTVSLKADGVAAIDIATGLPLLMQFRSHGPVQLPMAQGLVDYAMRSAIALPGMADPVTLLTAPHTDALAPLPPPVPEVATPAKRPARPTAQPTPPTATAPAKPAPTKSEPAKSAPAGTDDVAKRLEQLKSLFDRGLITKEQYEAKQKEFLGKL